MVVWYLLIISSILRVHANVTCFSGRSSENVTTEPLRPSYMCSVTLSILNDEALFMQHDCPSLGCHNNVGGGVYCCCNSTECNTISFYQLSSRTHHPIQYIGHFLMLIIIIAKLLILLNVNCGGRLKLIDMGPRFEDRIHIDFTQFTIQPRLSSGEANEIIERISSFNEEPTSVYLPPVKMHAVITYATNDRITYRDTKKQATLSNVNSMSSMEDILFAVIRLGPCEIDWDPDVVLAILARAYEVFQAEPTLLEMSPPIAIYGDLHGQYSDIWRWFRVNGWPPDICCLFLGDYVDRGRHSTEVTALSRLHWQEFIAALWKEKLVLMFVLLLKVVMPKFVFVCRGNHEDPLVNKSYNFYSEVRTRFPKTYRKLFAKISEVYSMMPIACLISDQILCMHGGLSPYIQTVSEIAALQKPIVTKNKQDKHIDILWSDPHIKTWTFEPNIYRDPAGVGVGHLFGPIQIRNFIKRNKLSLIVRAHQPPMSGYERIGKHLITIFSTPGYRVENNIGNMGASLIIDEDGTMDIIRMQVGEQLKLKRQRYKMDKGDRYRDCGKPKLKKVRRSSEEEKYS